MFCAIVTVTMRVSGVNVITDVQAYPLRIRECFVYGRLSIVRFPINQTVITEMNAAIKPFRRQPDSVYKAHNRRSL